MTQEEKLKEAKRLYETANSDQRYVLESLFPELKESEDERIRKSLIILLQHFCKGYRVPGLNFPVSYKDMLAWLEKQGSEENKGNLGGISPNSAWSEEDERNIQVIDSVLFYDKSLPEDTCMRLRNWLESLKQRLRE